MTVYEAVMKRRTIRKFKQIKIDHNDLLKLVDCARMAPYAVNAQPLKFKIIDDKSLTDVIFPYTRWGAALADGTPKADERPVSYIAVFGDTEIKQNFIADSAAAATIMILAAEEMGISSCWLGAIDKEKITSELKIPERYKLEYLIAFGYPLQKSRAVDMKNQSTKYYLTDDQVVNVPKRTIEDILL